MFNNNGGQGFQDPNAYYGTEHHARQLQREMGEQAERMRRQGNDLASWQNHCAVLEDALAQWQQSHARQAEQIRELEASWNRLRQNADNSIALWKAQNIQLKADKASLQARLDQALAQLEAGQG